MNTGFGALAQTVHTGRSACGTATAPGVLPQRRRRRLSPRQYRAAGHRAESRGACARLFGRAAGCHRGDARFARAPMSCRAFPPKARSAPRATSHRSRICSAALIGEGHVRLRRRAHAGGRSPAPCRPCSRWSLAPKEGLALLNGTQVSTALALAALFRAERIFTAAVVAGALSVDAAKGSDTPFDARIHARAASADRSKRAAFYRQLLDGSAIRELHLDCGRVQDPYSLRCQPQVMGACLDTMRHAAGILDHRGQRGER